jgi:sugar phosphate isomerase/epimerase
VLVSPGRLRVGGFGELIRLAIVEYRKEIAYRGWVSVEVFDYAPGIERLARESMQNMLRAIAIANRHLA